MAASPAQAGWVAPPNLSTVEWLAVIVILAAATWLIAIRLKTPPA